ncbi:CPBP family intramembrane glutamic endopeptidase [Arthrobacter bambusae]|uniref:Membrane protease YdiL (CAAX protease family) n=1 Tax=Arthrobacter bambusae TaxID=1338426 RepID=A0AAW8DHQ6_9MICC|nr:CPBP family intramembrane glutamic endopeptidase [Arthrobacter bambusae]MDP9905547.1 membrane protease YdiL (CAAX protease family) [Arthrobacter bambusae]MDQ0127371.1 membrane protease YdiL (CAAX protease family) [Arthrobacter bambusae]MDQ0178713.1 membrane protease YdiL (CAAX protease family) [Arthrobacter bambusae]
MTTSPTEPRAVDSGGGQPRSAQAVTTSRRPSDPNTPDAIRVLYSDRDLSWWPVLLFLPARGVLSFLAQAFTAAVLWSTGNPTPWESSQGWWTVYGTLTDAGCLGLLVILLRREGLRFRDTFGFTRTSLGPQLRSIPLYLLALLPAVAAASLVTLPFYGPAALPPQVTAIHLPGWAAVYSFTVWPLLWAFTEEITYLGFLLPRLQTRTGRTWKAAAIIIFFWSAQHLVIPFIPDGTYLISRFLGALLITAGLTMSFVLLRRRLLATTAVHWLSDASTAILTTLILGR